MGRQFEERLGLLIERRERKIIPINSITLTEQFTNSIDEVLTEQMAKQSFTLFGLMNDIHVLPSDENGTYKVLVGHHRLEAMRKSNIKDVDVIVIYPDYRKLEEMFGRESFITVYRMHENIYKRQATSIENNPITLSNCINHFKINYKPKEVDTDKAYMILDRISKEYREINQKINRDWQKEIEENKNVSSEKNKGFGEGNNITNGKSEGSESGEHSRNLPALILKWQKIFRERMHNVELINKLSNMAGMFEYNNISFELLDLIINYPNIINMKAVRYIYGVFNKQGVDVVRIVPSDSIESLKKWLDERLRKDDDETHSVGKKKISMTKINDNLFILNEKLIIGLNREENDLREIYDIGIIINRDNLIDNVIDIVQKYASEYRTTSLICVPNEKNLKSLIELIEKEVI